MFKLDPLPSSPYSTMAATNILLADCAGEACSILGFLPGRPISFCDQPCRQDTHVC
jgi:hypothetical protein